jgi:hypothetical protein
VVTVYIKPMEFDQRIDFLKHKALGIRNALDVAPYGIRLGCSSYLPAARV